MKKLSVIFTLLILTTIGCSVSTVNKKKILAPALSVQLWSVKNQLKSEFENTLKKLAKMGFSGVEFANEFGPFKNDPNGLKLLLTSLGLQASGAHVSFKDLNDKNFKNTVDFYQKLGVSNLVIGWDERAWDPKGVKEIVNLLNKLEKKLAPYEMKTGFHNHDQEFNPFQNSTYWDYMAQNTSKNVIMQLDAGWVIYTGKDPVEYVERYPGRTLSIHYKPHLPKGTKKTSGKLPIIGQDVTDWLSLLKVNSTVGGTKWVVVEQEEYPNGLTPLEALALSKKGLDAIIKNYNLSL